MIELRRTDAFQRWIEKLRDRQAKAKIAVRLLRLEAGLFGDAKSVGDGVSELRIPYGPGYRVYFTRRGREVVILLCGGDKSRQSADIAAAKAMAKEIET